MLVIVSHLRTTIRYIHNPWTIQELWTREYSIIYVFLWTLQYGSGVPVKSGTKPSMGLGDKVPQEAKHQILMLHMISTKILFQIFLFQLIMYFGIHISSVTTGWQILTGVSAVFIMRMCRNMANADLKNWQLQRRQPHPNLLHSTVHNKY